MKTKLIFSILILLFLGCTNSRSKPDKAKKIALHTFTGKGEHDETTTWYYIKNVIEKGFSGYYFENDSSVNDFKSMIFIHFKTRPPEFEAQAASNEKIEFLDTDDLPGSLLTDSANLESIYR